MRYWRSLRFRRLVIALLVFAVSSGLAGQWGATSRAQPSGAFTLLYSLPQPESAAMQESVLPAWQESHPDVEIEADDVPLDSLQSEVNVEVDAGTQVAAIGGPGLVGIGCCFPMPFGPWRFEDQILEAMSIDGELRGQPLGVSTVGLVYNTALIAAPPTSTDELREMAGSLASSGGQGFGLTPSFYLNAGYFLGYGSQVFDEGEPALDSPEVVEFLTFLESLAKEPGVVYGDAAQIESLFLEGQLAMTIGGPELVQAARDSLGSENVGVAVLPTISELGGADASPFLAITGVFVTSEEAAQAGAVEFAEWMVTEGAKILVDQGTGLLPVNTNVELPDDPATLTFVEQAEGATAIPTDPRMDDVWEPATEMIASVLEGQTSPEEAATAANEQVDRR
jgi:maltose-binding protein MalE